MEFAKQILTGCHLAICFVFSIPGELSLLNILSARMGLDKIHFHLMVRGLRCLGLLATLSRTVAISHNINFIRLLV